jgi:hypothetical protein
LQDEFRQHIYDQTDLTLRALQKFRHKYGSYFCTSNAESEIQRLVDLINIQPQLHPLLNITLEKHVPLLWGFLQPTPLPPRSFTQVFTSESSPLEEFLGVLAGQIAGDSAAFFSPFTKVNYSPPQTPSKRLRKQLRASFGDPDCLSVEFRRHSALDFSRHSPESLPSITFGTSTTDDDHESTIDSRSPQCSEPAPRFLEGPSTN